MNRLLNLLSLLCGLGLPVTLPLRAETYQFNDGTSITGDIISMDENGVRFRYPEGTYSEVIPWTKFTQAELRRLEKAPKAEALVAPFLEVSEGQGTELRPLGNLTVPERLPRPGTRSVIVSMFQSPLGWLLVLLMYAANIYAGFEVALFRARPKSVVCAVSAVLPVIGPIIFLAMPMQMVGSEEEEEGGEPHAHVAPEEDVPVVNPMKGNLPGGEHSSLHLHEDQAPVAAPGAAELPPPEVFSRGQFTFNRRFFETRFAKFFGTHHGSDKDKVLVVKSARREYLTTRIVRANPGDVVLQITKGTASEEVTVPYLEIQEIILKHKDAP